MGRIWQCQAGHLLCDACHDRPEVASISVALAFVTVPPSGVPVPHVQGPADGQGHGSRADSQEPQGQGQAGLGHRAPTPPAPGNI